jgi:hypothetical protein
VCLIHNSGRTLKITLVVLIIFALFAVAYAGEPSHVTVVPPVPPGFDPALSSPAVNAQLRLPPEPDPNVAPRTHEAWRRAVMAPREAPTIVASPIMHNPAHIRKTIPANGTASTDNWSGTVVTGGNLSNVEAITAMFVVPTPRVPFGTCNGTAYWSAYWPGLDGWGNGDILQAGVDQEVTCTNGQTSVSTRPWIEWYPGGPSWVSSPTINPGDLVFIEVWNTSSTQGWATIYDYSTDISTEYSITAPSGYPLQGVSVEWILERPGVPSLPLTNYIAMPWSEGVAWNYAATTPTTYSMGADPSGGTLQQITMLDNSELDNSDNPISTVAIENGSFLWFQNEGSSCGINLQPC